MYLDDSTRYNDIILYGMLYVADTKLFTVDIHNILK